MIVTLDPVHAIGIRNMYWNVILTSVARSVENVDADKQLDVVREVRDDILRVLGTIDQIARRSTGRWTWSATRPSSNVRWRTRWTPRGTLSTI